MLTKITLNNFKSFCQKTTIDFSKTNYTILPQNVSDNNVLKGCVFVGANASGKSNILLSIKLLLDLLFLDKSISLSNYLCLFSQSNQYCLEYEFKINNHIIRYCFAVETVKNVISESLYLDNMLMLERLGQSARSFIIDNCGTIYNDEDVSNDTLFLRTLYFNTKFASNNILNAWMEQLKKSIYINMFNKEVICYGKDTVSLLTYLDKYGCEPINSFFKAYNFNQSIEYSQNNILKYKSEDNILFKRNGLNIQIPFYEEALGNQNLLRILPAFLSAINNDSLLLIDEFSSGFHNELEELLIRYFMDKSKYSQMIFVSHSTNILSNSILRPDQEYSVEFCGKQGSIIRRFSSEQPRTGQNIEKMYISGVFGGLPNYQESFNDNQ